MGKSSINGSFSMAMLNNQRVYPTTSWDYKPTDERRTTFKINRIYDNSPMTLCTKFANVIIV